MRTRQYMAQVNPKIKLAVIRDGDHLATLATVIEREPEYGLYYVSVRPLFHLLRDRRNRIRTKLICCIYAYLYRVAKIPYPTDDQSTYISSEYDYLREREEEFEDDEIEVELGVEKGETARYIAMFDEGLRRCRRRFDQQRLLDGFANTLDAFTPKNDLDYELVKCAQRILELYETFPTLSFDQAQLYDYDDEANNYGERPIGPDQYVSFIWTDNDMVYHHIIESLNNEMSAGAEQGPYSCSVLFDRTYDSTKQLEDSEAYMVHLLDTMADFGNIMDKIENEQRNQRLSTVLPA